MKTTIKASLTALMMSSVAIGAVATIGTFSGADAAYAKSEKSGEKSGKSRGKSAESRGSKGKSEQNSTSRGSSGGGVEAFFMKLTGQEKKAAKSRAPVKAAKAPQVAKPKAAGGAFHSSELGNMNGALNANINAVLAHIRNGNTNGPVGSMAALAVAESNAVGADETIALADKFTALDTLLIENGYSDEEGNADLAAYQEALLATPGNGDIPEIKAAIDAEDAVALAGLLEINGFEDLAAYELYRDGEAGDPPIDEIDGLASELDGLDAPDEDAVAKANEDIQARSDAELAMLELWNKNADTSEEITEEEQALLKELYDRLEGNEDAIAAAIQSAGADDEMAEDLDDDIVDCGDPESCEDDEELMALAE